MQSSEEKRRRLEAATAVYLAELDELGITELDFDAEELIPAHETDEPAPEAQELQGEKTKKDQTTTAEIMWEYIRPRRMDEPALETLDQVIEDRGGKANSVLPARSVLNGRMTESSIEHPNANAGELLTSYAESTKHPGWKKFYKQAAEVYGALSPADFVKIIYGKDLELPLPISPIDEIVAACALENTVVTQRLGELIPNYYISEEERKILELSHIAAAEERNRQRNESDLTAEARDLQFSVEAQAAQNRYGVELLPSLRNSPQWAAIDSVRGFESLKMIRRLARTPDIDLGQLNSALFPVTTYVAEQGTVRIYHAEEASD